VNLDLTDKLLKIYSAPLKKHQSNRATLRLCIGVLWNPRKTVIQ
jgi:hypothetical protein